MATLFKSEQGKNEVFALYEEKLRQLDLTYESRFVDTTRGKTHLLITGPADQPPLLLVHGSNACAPIALEAYPELCKKYRVYAVDVLGQPNKSAEVRLSMKDDSYGQWMDEVMEALGLEQVTLLGFSFGGLVILKTLINHGSRVKAVFLAAPAYLVNGNPLKALWKVFIPMRRYMRTQKIAYIEKFLSVLFTKRDNFAIRFLSKVFLHFDMDFTPVPVISKQEAQKIDTPITLIAAEQDIMFPGKKMIKRAQQILPSLRQAVLLTDSKHVQDAAGNQRVEKLVLEDKNN